ncbi:MAG: penicillin-binding protein 2 [bacterium]|nr:penicillin-binding protein 2 [bacterium]
MTSFSNSGPDSALERRLAGAAPVVIAVWLLLLSRLFYLQVIEGETYRHHAERNSVRTSRVMAPRGMILDRNGEILVDSRPSFDVLVVANETDDLERTLGRIAGLADLERGTLLANFGKPRGRASFQQRRAAHDLPRNALARIEARLWALKGVLTQVNPVRAYPNGSSAAHLLGWLGKIDAEQLKSRRFQGYRPRDVIGKEGVEWLLDAELRGRDGGRNLLVDAHGRELQLLGAVAPQPGHNVVLTIDGDLQRIAEAALEKAGRNGAVVALDPRDGKVLVLANRPSYDPNLFAIGIDTEQWKEFTANPTKPLHNRAIAGQYPPGSTYKVVTALAGIEEGVIEENTRVHCGGSYKLGRRRYRCWKRGGHGWVDLHRAIVESCDVFFYQTGHKLGVDKIAYYARELGFAKRTGIELRGEMSGLIPTSAWKERRFGEPWIEGETISISIGQGFDLVTPIQLASVYAAIGNGGTRYKPYLVDRTESPEGDLIEKRAPEVLGEVPISREALAKVREGLRGVVKERRGTGYAMRRLPEKTSAAGKTGTAQVVALAKDPVKDESLIPEAQRDHAWFATYVPADEPRIAIAVLVEHGGHGSSTAAPIAAQIAKAFLEKEIAARPAPPEQEVAALGSH